MSRDLKGVFIDAPNGTVIGRRYRVWRKIGRGGKALDEFTVTPIDQGQVAGHRDEGVFLARRHEGKPILWRKWSKGEGDAVLSRLKGH
jgi:hypothetical protein